MQITSILIPEITSSVNYFKITYIFKTKCDKEALILDKEGVSNYPTKGKTETYGHIFQTFIDLMGALSNKSMTESSMYRSRNCVHVCWS